eukprot:TRINITY_DN68604_c0_g1_i1.p1 TRINITY_DN68604_c0_g1~~TRINITY_DN68604_c0_g1_i1.p1  ORF type:complete len:288 (-),score=18.87 TRINITY_DN68604_c0_g1_i1:114-977(-)
MPPEVMSVESPTRLSSLDSLQSVGQRHSHRIPWKSYMFVAVWFAMLTTQYMLTRFVCEFGIPHDCQENDDLEVMHDLQTMFTLGFVIAVMTGLPQAERFEYLFCFQRPRPRGFAFIVVFLGTGPVYGSLDLVPWLQQVSITPSFIERNGACTLLVLGLIAGALALLFWHFWCAWKHNSIEGFLAYTISRLAVWIFCIIYLAMAASRSDEGIHVHHYVIGFFCAILAEFNHPISMLLLAIASGVFVQGISAYQAAPVINPKDPDEILQFCMGYGGLLLNFLSNGTHTV